MLSVVQPFLLNLTLRALQGSEIGSSFPLRSVALALPDVFFTIPARAIASMNVAMGFQPTSVMFTTEMVPGDNRQMAYVYATIAFLCQLIKAQTDLQHLYFARRACTRIQSQLIGSIYEKTLTRKDITGVIASDAKKAKGKASDKKGDETYSDKAVASADVGKIVSLIATDATQCSNVANVLMVSCAVAYIDAILFDLAMAVTALVRNSYLFRRVLLSPVQSYGMDGLHWIYCIPRSYAPQLDPHEPRVQTQKEIARHT